MILMWCLWMWIILKFVVVINKFFRLVLINGKKSKILFDDYDVNFLIYM